jgi:hypothetical protein
MSNVIAAPELMAAATDLAAIGSALDGAHVAAALPTLAVAPAAADEVSAGIAQLFSQHSQDYQKLTGQAGAFHGQFVQNLTSSAAAYASAEDAIVSLLRGFGNALFDLVPPSLRAVVIGVPLIAAFFIAIPIVLVVANVQRIIEMITG